MGINRDSPCHTRCQICGHAVGLKLRFHHSPLLLVFSIPQMRILYDTTFKISITNSDHKFTLAAVIYYANFHFTAQIITRESRVTEETGNFRPNRPSNMLESPEPNKYVYV